MSEAHFLQLLSEKGLTNFKRIHFVAGTDEVGRGPLAGPVVAVTCLVELSRPSLEKIQNILLKMSSWGICDSKILSAKKRQRFLAELGICLNPHLSKKCPSLVITGDFKYQSLAVHFAISEISQTKIDEINIFQSSLLAMKRSIKSLPQAQKMGMLLVDGKYLPSFESENILALPVIKGDQHSLLIGLASLIAKEYRDLLMKKWDEILPGYGLGMHAGYPTKYHREKIQELGITFLHRKSFKGVREYCGPSEGK